MANGIIKTTEKDLITQILNIELALLNGKLMKHMRTTIGATVKKKIGCPEINGSLFRQSTEMRLALPHYGNYTNASNHDCW